MASVLPPPTRRYLPAPLFGSLVALALCGLLPLMLIASTPAPVLSAWPLALVSSIVAGMRFTWAVSTSMRRLYEMMTWLFIYLFLGLAPLVQLRRGIDPGTTPNLFHEYDSVALTLVIVFEITLIAGSSFARRYEPSDSNERPSISPSTRPIHRGRLIFALVALLGVSTFYIARVGPSSIWSSRVDRGAAAAVGFGDDVVTTILTAVVTLGLLVAVVALLQHRRERRIAGHKGGLLLLVVSVGFLLFLANPIGSPRFVLATVYLGLLAGAGVFSHTSRFRGVSVAAIGGMFLIFPILDTFRFSTQTAAQFTDPVTSLIRGDYDSYAQIVNTAWSVDQTGITWGNQLLGVLLFWVPRSSWPTKPQDTGIFLAEQRGYVFENLSAPFPAELYVNFGWIGVIIGGFILGVALRKLDISSECRLRVIGTPTILGSIIPFYLLLLLRGSLLQAAANLAVMLAVWWFVTSSSRLPERHVLPAGQRRS